MADAEESLRSMIRRLRAFGQGAEVAREAAPLIEQALKATAAAGTDPDGKPWKSKKDGSRALPDAADALTVTPGAMLVTIRVRGGEAVQNRFGFRRMLPRRKQIPKAIYAALREGAARAWKKAMST